MTLTPEEEARAYALVAGWHRDQGYKFREMSNDEPRIDKQTRLNAHAASVHHYGSAAALEKKAMDARRRAFSA